MFDPVVPIIAATAVSASAALYLAPVGWKRVAIARLRRRCVERRVLCLTFDDGPGPNVTEELLGLLDEFDARASFYLGGERIAEHHGLVERLAASGHELCCHGFHHLHAWRSGPRALAKDLARGGDAVRDVSGAERVGFRPPYGKLVLPTWIAARRAGYRIDWWTDDSGDSFPELPEQSPALDIVERGGGVALFHDLDRSDPRNRFVLETTRALLEGARERGLAAVTMAELMAPAG